MDTNPKPVLPMTVQSFITLPDPPTIVSRISRLLGVSSKKSPALTIFTTVSGHMLEPGGFANLIEEALTRHSLPRTKKFTNGLIEAFVADPDLANEVKKKLPC